jgi:hypothetical protein
MITDDEVMRLFERADPARLKDVTPTIDSWGYLEAIVTRSNDMTITESETTTQLEPTRPPRWSMIVLAAAAVVAIVGGGIVLASRDEPAQPVTNQPAAVTEPVAIESNASAADVARGFVDAFGAFDTDQAMSYLADGAEFSGLQTQSTTKHPSEELPATIAMAQAMGWKQIVDGCEPQDTTAVGTTVRCTLDFHYLRSEDLGLGPFSGSYIDMTVVDGQIVDVAGHCEIEVFSVQVWGPFADWLTATYPDDVDVMFNGAAIDSTELTGLWEQRLQAYVDAAGQ